MIYIHFYEPFFPLVFPPLLMSETITPLFVWWSATYQPGQSFWDAYHSLTVFVLCLSFLHLIARLDSHFMIIYGLFVCSACGYLLPDSFLFSSLACVHSGGKRHYISIYD